MNNTEVIIEALKGSGIIPKDTPSENLYVVADSVEKAIGQYLRENTEPVTTR